MKMSKKEAHEILDRVRAGDDSISPYLVNLALVVTGDIEWVALR